MERLSNQNRIFVGEFGTAPGIGSAAPKITMFNDYTYNAVVGTTALTNGTPQAIMAGENQLYLGGNIVAFTPIGTTPTRTQHIGFLTLRNNVFLPIETVQQFGILIGTVTINEMERTNTGTIYMAAFPDGGGNGFEVRTAAITTVVNSGNANSSPQFIFRNYIGSASVINVPNGTFTPTLYRVANLTTNTEIFFNYYTMVYGEVATLTLDTGSVSFTSNYRGNILSSILPTSNIASFKLAKGTNQLAVFVGDPSVRVDLVYRPRLWSLDGSIS
jgi:hypothetical protein